MPTFTQQGNTTTYHFGLGAGNEELTISGVAVESITIEETAEFEAEGKRGDGHTVAYATGPAKKEIRISGYLVDVDEFQDALTVDFNSTKYLIMGKSKRETNTEFQRAEITAVKYAGVTVV